MHIIVYHIVMICGVFMTETYSETWERYNITSDKLEDYEIFSFEKTHVFNDNTKSLLLNILVPSESDRNHGFWKNDTCYTYRRNNDDIVIQKQLSS